MEDDATDPAEYITADDLREARDKVGESQARFSKRFDVDQSTYHRWEKFGPPQRGSAAIAIRVVVAGIIQSAAA